MSFEALRRELPLLDERLYLTTHCVGPLPRGAITDLDEYRRTVLLGSRGIGPWADRFDHMHRAVELLLGAPPGSVALGPNATNCQGLFAASIGPSSDRNVIVTTDLDFRSTSYLWKAQIQRGFTIREVRARDGYSFPDDALLDAIDERVAVVSVPLVSYRSGAMVDVAAVVKAARSVGALVIFDAYQALGVVPVDVVAQGIDALVGGTHKWLHGGGPGLAFLYVRPDLAATLAPAYPGWMAHRDAAAYSDAFVPAEGARRFEQGIPPIEPLYSSAVGLALLRDVGIPAIRERSVALTQRLIAGADELGIALRTPRDPARRGGMLCLAVQNPNDVVAQLERRGIDVDSRPDSGIRVSPHPCTTEAECDRFLAEITSLIR